MKNILFCVLLVAFVSNAAGQQFYLETGMVISSFNYRNSDGDRLTDLKGTNLNGFGIGAAMPVMKSPWMVFLELSNNKYGATASDPEIGNFSEWDVSCLGLTLGGSYEFFKPRMINIDREGFSVTVRAALAPELLIAGKQKLNSQVYDLSGEEEFDKPFFFVKGGVSVNYYLTRNYIVFSRYMFGRSLLFGNYDGQEKLNIMSHTISLGFALDISHRRN